MHIANIAEAKSQLSKLIQQALAGNDVIIARDGQPLVKLLPCELDTSPRVGGQWAGKVHYSTSVEAMDAEVAALFGSSALFPDGDA